MLLGRQSYYKPVNDLALFDGQRKEVDLFQGGDLSLLDQSAEFGDRGPATLALFLAATARTAASTASAATAASAASTATTATTAVTTES